MHLYLLTRGIKHCVDRYISDLSAQYFPYGDPKDKLAVQLAVRPLQIWEIVFAKQNLPEVVKTVLPQGAIRSVDKKNWSTKYMSWLAKMLKAKKMPDFDLKDVPSRLIYKDFVAAYPIGVKADEIWKDGQFKGYERL